MNMNDMQLRLLRGLTIKIGDLCDIHPLTIDAISLIGESLYNKYLATIIFNQDNLEIDGEKLNKLETLSIYCFQSNELRTTFCEALKFLSKENVNFHSDGFFYFGSLAEKRILTFELYQEIIEVVKKQNFMKDKVEEEEYIPHDDIARELIDKLKKIKQQIKEQNSEEGLDIGDIVSIVACYSNDLNILNVWHLTVYQLYTVYMRLMMKDGYDSKFSMVLQGADIDSSELLHWARKANN